MKTKFFKISTLDPIVAEKELNAFCSSHQISHLEKHFVADAENSFWAIAITYIDETSGHFNTSNKRSAKVDYKEILSPEDFAVYAQLRDLRTTIATREGIPTYAVFTNEQLSQIVLKNIRSKTALQSLEGIGEKRAGKYAEELCQYLDEIDKKS